MKARRAPTTSERSATHARLRVRQRVLLRAFEALGTVTHAATAAKVHRSMHYAWLRDPAYARAFEEAVAVCVDRLEHEADRRAVDGWDRPVYQGGQLVGYQRLYDGRLLELRLKALRPEVYRERVEAKHASPPLDGLWEVVLAQVRAARAGGSDGAGGVANPLARVTRNLASP